MSLLSRLLGSPKEEIKEADKLAQETIAVAKAVRMRREKLESSFPFASVMEVKRRRTINATTRLEPNN